VEFPIAFSYYPDNEFNMTSGKSHHDKNLHEILAGIDQEREKIGDENAELKALRRLAVLRRLDQVETRVRWMTILGAIFLTLQVLTVIVFVVLMSPANYWVKLPLASKVQESLPIKQNPVASKQELVTSKHEYASPQPGSGISQPGPSTGKKEPSPSQQESPPAPQVSQAVPEDSLSVKPAAEEANLQGSDSALPVVKSPVTYVGSRTSNKYHRPECKWVKEIARKNLITFKSVKEAQEAGYIRCPACKPPLTD
jgi:hypothetical protein